MTDNLVVYELWALRRILDALETTPAPRYKAQLVYAHILNGYRLWHDRIRGVEISAEPWDERSLDDCRAMLADLERDYGALLEDRSAGRAPKSVGYENTRGVTFANTLEDILQHVLLHSAYHRGQVNMLIRQSGGEPAVVDYIAFARDKGNG